MQQLHRLIGDQGRLFRRLGQHRISCRQGRRDLTGENGQRKIPGGDAQKDTTAMQRYLINLSRWSRQGLWLRKLHTGAHRIIAQEVHSLPQFRNCIIQGFASLTHNNRHQAGSMLLI